MQFSFCHKNKLEDYFRETLNSKKGDDNRVSH